MDKYNHEHYYDPTAQAALASVRLTEQHAPRTRLVFICSPFAGDVEENVARACAYCRFAVDEHVVPFAPHLLFTRFLNDGDPAERRTGLELGLAVLRRCDELWVFGDRVSPGMAAEIAEARRIGLRIRYFNKRFEEVEAI